jgi:hypothetical protein
VIHRLEAAVDNLRQTMAGGYGSLRSQGRDGNLGLQRSLIDSLSSLISCHSGAAARLNPESRSYKNNIEIPGSMLRIAPE